MSQKSQIIKKLDSVFSEYIRTKNVDSYGFTHCFTCNCKDYWYNLQCGHFISRKYFGTRWDENNARPQCKKCNCFLNGNLNIFSEKLLNEIGKKEYELLFEKSHKIAKITAKDMGKLVNVYNNRVNVNKN